MLSDVMVGISEYLKEHEIIVDDSEFASINAIRTLSTRSPCLIWITDDEIELHEDGVVIKGTKGPYQHPNSNNWDAIQGPHIKIPMAHPDSLLILKDAILEYTDAD